MGGGHERRNQACQAYVQRLGSITKAPTLPWLTALLAWRGTHATFWRTAFFEVKHPNTVAFSSSYTVMAQRQANPDEKTSPTQFFLLPIAEVASLLRKWRQ